MLAGDKTLVTTLRGLKSAILYAEVAKGSRDLGLPDSEVIALLSKEAKKRQESSDLYLQGGNAEKSAAELVEKQVIERYLPQQLSDVELSAIVEEIMATMGEMDNSKMGQAIGAVKARVGATVEGSRIASAVKERIS